MQKRIWGETKNKFGVKDGYKNYLRFASSLGWYVDITNDLKEENPAKWVRFNNSFWKNENLETGGLPTWKWATMAGGHPYQGILEVLPRCDL